MNLYIKQPVFHAKYTIPTNMYPPSPSDAVSSTTGFQNGSSAANSQDLKANTEYHNYTPQYPGTSTKRGNKRCVFLGCFFWGGGGHEGMSVSNRFEYIQRGVVKISLNVDMLYLFSHCFLEFSNFKRNASLVETESKMFAYFLQPFCCVKCQVFFCEFIMFIFIFCGFTWVHSCVPVEVYICMQMYTLHLYSGQLTLTTPPLHQTAKKFIICPNEHSAGHHGPMRVLLSFGRFYG